MKQPSSSMATKEVLPGTIISNKAEMVQDIHMKSIPRYLRQRANHRAGFFKWTNQSEEIDMTQ